MRTYLVHLEKQGKVKNAFVNPFRTRPPWEVCGEREKIGEGHDIE